MRSDVLLNTTFFVEMASVSKKSKSLALAKLKPTRERQTPAALLYLVFAIGLITLPALPYAGDPVAWREEGRSIVVKGTLAVDPEIARRFGEPGQFFVINHRNGHYYSKYGILNGLLVSIPLTVEYLLKGDLQYDNPPERILIFGVFYLLIAVAIAGILYKITGYYSANRAARATYVLIVFYATYLWNYLRSTSAESTLLLGFLAFWFAFLRLNRRQDSLTVWPPRAFCVPWLAIALLTQTRLYFGVLIPLFASFLAWIAWRNNLRHPVLRETDEPTDSRSSALKAAIAPEEERGGARGNGVVCPVQDQTWMSGLLRLTETASFVFILRAVVLPAGLIFLMLGAVNQVKFGNPFLSGYHQWFDPPNPHTVWTVLKDFLFSAQWSFFVCFPPLLLALFGMRRFFHEHRAEAVFLLVVFLVFFVLIEKRPSWHGGWAYGPRYFVFILPALALPALYTLEWAYTRTSKWMRGAALGLLSLAGAFMVIAQMQVNRLDFFFKYKAQLALPTPRCRVANEYFQKTSFAKIHWDHIRADGRWERLPYYTALERQVPPELLANWRDRMHSLVSRSNLYWFR